MNLLPVAVIVCLLAGLTAPLFYRFVGSRVGRLLALLPLILFISFFRLVPEVARGQAFQWSRPWIPVLGVEFSFSLDGLSLLFALLITGIGTLVLYYGASYLGPKEDHGKFFAYMMIFMAAMLGVVTANNLVLLFLFWEMTSFSSFLLIGFWHDRDASRYGALKALLVTGMGGLCMMAGLIFVFVVLGSVDLREVLAGSDALRAHGAYPAILVLFLLAAFTKSAQAPFHLWLPNAMEAPTPVSAYLHSAAMVKAGIYLVARMSPVLGGTALWTALVGGVGIITLVLGSYLALRQTDLKAILAFSTVSQLGLIIALLGWGTPLAVTAAVFHTLNHSVFKAALFMGVGIVDHQTGTRDIERLGGLAKGMPLTALAMGLAALALAGVPPFNGFVSKEMFFEAALRQSEAAASTFGLLWPVLAVLGSVLTFVYSLILSHRLFFAKGGPELKETPTDPGPGLIAPPIVLGGLALLFGLAPGMAGRTVVLPGAAAVLGGDPGIHLALWHGINAPLLLSSAVIAGGLILYRQLPVLLRIVHGVPGRINVNAVYDWAVDALVIYSERVTQRMMTGFTRDYFAWFQWFFLGIIILGAAAVGGISLNNLDLAPVTWYEGLLALTALAGGLALLWLRTRMAAIVALGMTGFALVAFFVVFRAPDLAMTLLIVESATVILVLLAFIHLPRLREEVTRPPAARANALVSIGSGLAVTMLMLGALAFPAGESVLARYFLQNSRELAGGYNVVNVILVDFRGFDTMGEITVLGLAAMGVYMLLNLRARKRQQ